MDSSAVAVAVDIGGTTIKAAIVGRNHVVHDTRSIATPPRDVVGAVAVLAETLRDRASHVGLTVVAVGVVAPGTVDEEQGVVRYASNLRWTDVPLRALLEARLGVPVAVGHDVRSAARAEQLSGGCMGLDDFAFVQIGTGVAAAVVCGGRMLSGTTGSAGEFGHIPIWPDGETCVCGQRGCLEVYMSGAGVARRYAAHGGGPLTCRQVVAAAASDAVAARVWDDAVDTLACGIATLTLLCDPGAVILGGGVAEAGDALIGPLVQALRRRLVWREPPHIMRATLGSQASRVGAAALALDLAATGATVAGA